MSDLIRLALTWVLHLVLPGTGRHRAGSPYPLARRRLALVLAADCGIDLDRHVRGAVA
ncbi:hypothetical protein ACIRJS_29365 [Streptomyces sp. NPDC102340]|uniref:hypothetical protein n=1 Tax=unclassified Streptomyces TaxID=2593676 RepID=UPI0038247148